MGLLDNYYISRYNIVNEKIEKLNLEEQKGYNSFVDYVLADRKLKIYFEELKSIKKRCKKIKVKSDEEFNNEIKIKLIEIYEKRILNIFDSNNNEKKESKLCDFKEELNKCIGYGFDSIIRKLISDIDEKIYNKKKYIVTNSEYEFSTYAGRGYIDGEILTEVLNIGGGVDFDNPDILLEDAIDLIMQNRTTSTSFIQRNLKIGYSRAKRIIKQMEERNIIDYNDGNPQILITKETWENMKLKNINKKSKMENKKVLKKLTDEEYTAYKRKQEIDKMSDEEFLKMYGIDTNYNSGFSSFDNIYNSLIIESVSDDDKVKFINSILKYDEPQKTKLILINQDTLDFQFYNDLPNMLLPVISEEKMANNILKWILQEINARLNMFYEQKVKDFNSYNEKTDGESLPSIVLIIGEIYDFLRNNDNKDIILRILLNGERAGIKCIFYSKFSRKNLNIGSMEDLIHIYTKYSPIISDYKNENNTNISNIDYDMNGFDFEKYAGELLQKNGFEKVAITQCSGDFGVDLIAYKEDIKYAIQCKKYSSPVGIKAVQEVIASKAMNNCHVAVVLTNNYFTKSAKELAEKNNVLLWDRDKLLNLINKTKSND